MNSMIYKGFCDPCVPLRKSVHMKEFPYMSTLLPISQADGAPSRDVVPFFFFNE